MKACEILRRVAGRNAGLGLMLAVVLGSVGCKRREAQPSTYYDRKIGPILTQSCAASATKSFCHTYVDSHENALGNLSVESYESLSRRRDLLLRYGPYNLPALLLKVAPPFVLSLTTWQSTEPILVTTDIPHVGGSPLDLTSPSFTVLDNWISGGAALNNAPPNPPKPFLQACSDTPGNDPAFDANFAPTSADFPNFQLNVNPVVGERCAAGNCHGSLTNSLYLTCGKTAAGQRWNYFVLGDYVSVDTGASEILRRALSPREGGVYHEGGTVFETTTDPGYQALTEWATEKGGPTNQPTGDGFLFFASRVQPMLVKRGCMMVNCHSGSMFHDYRLRGGSGGHFGLPATRKNYELSLEQLALESPDPNASRLIRKNIPPLPKESIAHPPPTTQYGMLHRGGPLFASQYSCSAAELDAAASGPLDQQPPYCVIAAWFQKERDARLSGAPALSGIVFVRRPPAAASDTPQEYATYAPGAEVVRAQASLDAQNHVLIGAESSLSVLCGLNPTTSDARRATVSWDAQRIAFSARASASDPFHVYVVDGTSCAIEPSIDAPAVDDSGNPVPDNAELVHNFDPAFAPDGSIVFASTRGNTKNVRAFSYHGPQHTPADPTKLNSNLYVLEAGKIRQLTFLLNQELSPAFMRDGRVIFVTEKREPGFYQLAGRRINLDGGDYHPLFGQRSTIGFNQVTDVVELADKNLAMILSNRGAVHGAGTLAVLNRSIGIDQGSTDVADYTQDPAAINFLNPDFFQHSLHIVDPLATGNLSGTQGAYRSPAPLPTKNLLVSYAANVVALDNFSGNFDIVEIDPATGVRLPLISGPNDELWPVAVAPRFNYTPFRSRLDEANGATQVFDDAAHNDRSHVTFLDLRVMSSLLFQNTRTGRILPRGLPNFSVWEELPPDPCLAAGGSFTSTDAFGPVFVCRRLLGSPQIYSDASAVMEIPGGMPIVLQTDLILAGETTPTQHFQREEMQFYPGEVVRQAFRQPFFNGLCAGCHASIEGFESRFSVNPDILTQASAVEARIAPPTDLRNSSGALTGPVAP